MRRITTSYAIVTPESAEAGDYAESGWEDQDGHEFDDVDEAIEWLRREGIGEPSSSSFHTRIWYVGVPTPDYATGAEKTLSYHLKGFSAAEQRKVFDAFARRSNPMKKHAVRERRAARARSITVTTTSRVVRRTRVNPHTRGSTRGWKITWIGSHAARAVSGDKLVYAIRRERGGAVQFDFPRKVPAWVKAKMRKMLRGTRIQRGSFLRSNPAGAADPRGSVYGQRFKLRGYRSPVSVLTVHTLSGAKSILRRLFPTHSKEDHAKAAAAHERAAKRFETLWGRTVDKAHRETFGKKWSMLDYRISGVGRDEYPTRLKNILRMAAQRGSAHEALAHYHRALAGRARS